MHSFKNKAKNTWIFILIKNNHLIYRYQKSKIVNINKYFCFDFYIQFTRTQMNSYSRLEEIVFKLTVNNFVWYINNS